MYMDHESVGDTNNNWYTRSGLQRLGRWTESVGNRQTHWDYPNYSITKISENTEKSPEDNNQQLLRNAYNEYNFCIRLPTRT